MIRDGDRADSALLAELPEFRELVAVAAESAGRARAPYSEYAVGSAVIDERGVITGGCNLESAAFAATVCAERAAIAGAIAAGGKVIRACVTVARDEDPASCCGVCRQLLAEFGPDVIVANASLISPKVRWGTIEDWLPFGFSGASLDGAT